MKLTMYVEYEGIQTDYKVLENSAKEIWKAENNKVKDLKTLALYFKPQENKCYYVFNETIKGSFPV